jgi:PAS domain S-box-containing protein
MKLHERPFIRLLGMPYEVTASIFYLIFAIAFVVIYDSILFNLYDEAETVIEWLIYEAIAFAVITAVILYAALRRIFNRFRDIQVNLKVSEERYRMLIESHSDLVVKVDREGRLLYASPTYCKLFGKTEEELLGKNFMPLVHEDDRASTEEAMKALFEPPHEAYMEQRAMTKEGWRWLSWQDSTVLDKKGQVSEIIGVGRDITQRKETEEAHRVSNERLKLATTGAQIGIWEYDFTSDHLFWDEQMFKLYCIDEADFGSAFKDWQQAVHPEDIEAAEAEFMSAVRGEKNFDTQFRILWPDGSVHHIRAVAVFERSEDGEPVKAVGTNWDITPYREAVDALQASEHDYRQLFENMTTGFVLLKVVYSKAHVPEDFIILEANPAATEIDGRPKEEMMGRSFREAFPEIEPYWIDIFSRVATTGTPSAYENRVESLGLVLETWVFVPKPDHIAVVFSDNTARRTAEDAVLRAQQQLQMLVNNSRDVIFEIDLEGNYTYVNVAAEELTGYPPEKLLTMNITDLICPEYRDMTRRRLEKRIAGNPEQGFFSFEIQHSDGHRLWLELATTGVYDAEGQLVSVQGIARDVTDRKAVEHKLEESRQFLRTVIDTIPVRVFWKDLDSSYLGGNMAFTQDAGFKHPEELVGRTDYDMSWGKAEADLYRGDDRVVMESGMPKLGFEEPQQRSEESGKSWLSTSKVPLRNSRGDIIGVLGTYEDITSRKRLEEERVRLIAAITQSAEAIVMMDTDGIIQFVNPAFEEMSGYTRDEAVGNSMEGLRGDDHSTCFTDEIREAMAQGRSWRGALDCHRKDGQAYSVDLTVSPVQDPDGEVVNQVATIRDITQELAMEKQLRQIQKMDAVGRLAGGVAHDFNNILQSILGFSGILLTELDEDTTQYNDVREIRKAARRAGDLTSQLLAFSRNQSVEYRVVDLNNVVRDSEIMMRRLVGERIEVEFQLEAAVKPVKADATQLSQILLNLFINACDAMADGGRLTISTRNEPAVEHSAYGAEGAVCLTVRDTGIGIDSETREHLFEPFFTTKSIGKGTGLGLSVVYGIVQQHGGWVDVDSEPGKGAAFHVHLPVQGSFDEVDEADETQLDIAQTPDGKGESILVIEDDPVVLDLNVRVLEKAGYRVKAAADAAQAGALLESGDRPFDLIFCDMVLPDRDGLELAEAISLLSPGLPILLCSGYSHTPDVHERIQERGFRYLQKPVSAMPLLQTVREMLDGGEHV